MVKQVVSKYCGLGYNATHELSLRRLFLALKALYPSSRKAESRSMSGIRESSKRFENTKNLPFGRSLVGVGGGKT